jgi:hypothetical protein
MQNNVKYLAQGNKKTQLGLIGVSHPVTMEKMDPVKMAVELLKKNFPQDPKGKYPKGSTVKDQIIQDIKKGLTVLDPNYKDETTVRDFDVLINRKPTWEEFNNYVIFVDPENRNKISGIIGMSTPIIHWENIPYGLKPIPLGNIDKTTYEMIKMSVGNIEAISFWNNDRIEMYRIMLELDLETTQYDINQKALVGLDNTVRFKAYVHDHNGIIIHECNEIIIKKMRERKTQIINTCEFISHPGLRKITVSPREDVTVKLLGDGRHILRVKAMIPFIHNRWLTCYPECQRLTEEELLVLGDNISSMDIPNQMNYEKIYNKR